jgi:hypothetical protein
MYYLRNFLREEANGTSDGGGASTTTTTTDTTQQSHSSDPVFRQILSDDGKFADGWQDKLPAEYDQYKATLANFKDFSGLTKSLQDSMTAARAKTDGMVKLPAADAKPEEIAAYHKALGVPEKLPEGMEWNQEFADDFSKTAHGLGLTPAQVQGLSKWHQERNVREHQQFEQTGSQEFEKQQQELKKAFGTDYEKRIIDAKRVAATIGLDPETHPVFYRADTVLALTKMADMISEDKLVSVQQVANNLTPETQAKDIMTNPGNPDYAAYNNPQDARNKEVVARVNGLFQRAYPK